jgi:hypothetical protein
MPAVGAGSRSDGIVRSGSRGMGQRAHTSRCRALAPFGGLYLFAVWRLGYSSEHHAMLTFSRLVDKTGHDPTKSPGASRTGAFFAFALLSQTCRARCTRYMPWLARRSARPRFFIRWLMYETVISAYGTKRTCKPR